jgi:hypothetical protein
LLLHRLVVIMPGRIPGADSARAFLAATLYVARRTLVLAERREQLGESAMGTMRPRLDGAERHPEAFADLDVRESFEPGEMNQLALVGR